jgi:hypothetical protein
VQAISHLCGERCWRLKAHQPHQSIDARIKPLRDLIGDRIEIDFCHTNLNGMPHVSFTSEIIQLVGPKAVPVVVAGSVLGVFELGERLASQRAKDALSKWLLTFDVKKAAGTLPDGTQELFERIFGERHFTLKCFIRSVAFSLGTIAFISIICLLINPNPRAVFDTSLVDPWMVFALWIPWSIAIDYVSLFKTRFVLGLLSRLHRGAMMVTVFILCLDYVAYKVIFFLGTVLVLTSMVIVDAVISMRWADAISIEWVFISFKVLFNYFDFLALGSGYSEAASFIMFLAGLAPSIWLWLYVAALFVTRAILRSEKLVNWLRWGLDVEKAPFRSIGAVAAALAFIASVAIILVSVEVSMISAAA